MCIAIFAIKLMCLAALTVSWLETESCKQAVGQKVRAFFFLSLSHGKHFSKFLYSLNFGHVR